MSPAPIPPWLTDSREAWYAEVQSWLTSLADSSGLGLGSVESVTTVKERSWAVVLRVEFTGATTYFKASGAGGLHETGLVMALRRNGWHFVLPEVLAAEVGRGWMLMADAGLPLWQVLDPPGQLATLVRVLPVYAELQASTPREIDLLLRLGLPDRRLDRLPALLAELLSSEDLAASRGASTLAPLKAAARARLPALTAVCQALAASPCPAALDHGDLHPGNILARNGEHRFCDWGDSCITHPFLSLGVTLENAAALLPAADRDAALRLRAAYLEPWSGHGSAAALERDLRRALWVAPVLRALDFARMFAGGDAASRARWLPLLAEPLERWVLSPPPPHP